MKSVSIVHAKLILEELMLTRYAAQDESALCDQRTFDAFMNCESLSQPTFEERMRLGPLPRVSICKALLNSEREAKEYIGKMGEIEPNNRSPLYSS